MINRLDFVVVGPQRTGSSWLDRALRTHPKVALPAFTKETFAFDSETEIDLHTYFQRYFSNAESGQKVGEIGPTYFHNPRARDRLRTNFPDLKIIILLRDPVERTYSLFRHEVAKGRSPDDLFRAIEQNPEIVESGRYAKHVVDWQRDFGNDRVQLLWFDDIEARGAQMVMDVHEFIGVSRRQLNPEILDKYGSGVVPRFQLLATMAARTARFFRSAGMDRVVEGAKRIGLKPLFFQGGDTSKLALSQAHREYLEQVHADDIRFILEQKRTFHGGKS
ncbi:sulfotransferase [Roseobacter sp. AzwK-3b]|uniref:sulfotransferase family protein n=1 Tax=Roseobacter sp. AzwK-3b TaxID=351016 RepID=UPI0012F4AC73|nr:sulfotransferase [Roseobacter sp. AzwK-3b]